MSSFFVRLAVSLRRLIDPVTRSTLPASCLKVSRPTDSFAFSASRTARTSAFTAVKAGENCRCTENASPSNCLVAAASGSASCLAASASCSSAFGFTGRLKLADCAARNVRWSFSNCENIPSNDFDALFDAVLIEASSRFA